MVEKPNNRGATSTEAGPSNHSRVQLVASGSTQNQVHEVEDGDDEDEIQEVEARAIPTRGGNNNRKRKENHAVVENEDDGDEIQEVDPPPPKMTRSRGGSRKPSSTVVNGKPTSNGAAKGKAKAKPKSGPMKPTATKPVQEPMDVDLNDNVVEHDMDMGVNDTAAIADTINAAIKHNASRAPKSGKQNEDGRITRLEEELRQVRFIGNYRPLSVVSY